MDAIAQMQETDIMKVVFPTISTLIPLLAPKRPAILDARKTFKYGATERHQLDVYYPPSSTTTDSSPILFYVYGGGFASGGRTLPAPADLAYGNVGLYFASRGFITVIPDYRLAPETTYPGPAEDLRDALKWAVDHPDELGPNADLSTVFFLGHSAGGTHTATMFLETSILAGAPELARRIKGVAIASAPFHFEGESEGGGADVREKADIYYGSASATQLHNPLVLLRRMNETSMKLLPRLVLITCENDPEWFKTVLRDFHQELAKREVNAKLITAKVHNHISFSMALGTGQGEEWAEELVDWARTTA
ncbi:esterase lipase thioesterase family protein [Favolaschia claudopus]|uniref:Esterase lipase thioesterase family protein n=1 Tax=Favolaschia claudopus TaxID=2862362 RepID=A0AAW0CA13_9AGAR